MALTGNSIPKFFALALLLLVSGNAANAQRRVSADVEVKQLTKQSVMTNNKSVYCTNNGRLVVCSKTPTESIMVTNQLGETRMYFPARNEVLVDNSGQSSSKNELLSLFLFGRMDDLGLGLEGYTLSSSEMEDGLLKKTFTSKDPQQAPRAEIVYKDYLPIYLAFLNLEGRIVSKTYFSNYRNVGRMQFPHRSTNISYVAKGDSTVVRTIYSNVKVDVDDPMFNFQVPSDAKEISLKDIIKK